MQHGADATPEKRIDEFTGALPFEVRIVQFIVLVENVQIVGQLLGGRELIDVNVRAIRCRRCVVFGSGAHHNGQYIAIESVDEEFLGYVVFAVGVLEGQIEFVLVIQDLEAFAGRAAGTLVRAARSVNVHLCEFDNDTIAMNKRLR